MEAAGLDSSKAHEKVRAWQAKQRDFIRQTGLKRQYNREQIGKVIDESAKKGYNEDEEVFDNSTPEQFAKALKEAKATVDERDRWRVTAYEAEHYINSQLHVTEGAATVAVDETGNIISLCHKSNGRLRGWHLLEKAVRNGGIKLDSFSGNHNFYARNGFKPISWCEFNEEFAPDDWMGKKEDIIFYIYIGEVNKLSLAEFKNQVKGSVDYDVAMTIRDNLLKR